MSTKAIREALAELEQHASTDCGTEAMAAEVRRKLAAALAGVEAIERASVVLMDDATTLPVREEDTQKIWDALDVFSTIAEEAKP